MLKKLLRDQRSRWNRSVEELRFKVWLSANGANSEEEIRNFCQRIGAAIGLDIEKLPALWASGKIAKRSTIDRTEDAFPGSSWTYFFPLWDLLIDKAWTKGKIERVVADYRHEIIPWAFPRSENPEAMIAVRKDDSDLLCDRGDIYGLMAILAVMREAEIDRDLDSYGYHFMNFVRCLPWAAKKKWLADNFGEFCRLVSTMHLQHMAVRHRFNIDWKMIHQQFLIRDEYRPRNFRNRDSSGRFIVYDDPIIYTNTVDTWQKVEF